ncbi:MAG TPA: MFS transporter [Solirubrobacteraceae bacterium]|jgi:predicted MFS family arabinose efflux permease|nr:MFS transporter [Solirubrobacteraceae bacterium]
MNYPTALLSRPRGGIAIPRLGHGAAFALLASAGLTLLASSSAPTPLYATYQAKWGFSDLTVTVIFGVYAVAVLASLLVFGSLSDHVGRKPLLIAGLGLQVPVMLLFAFAGNLDVLLAARVLQGLATGAALGAIGAGLVDLHPTRGPVANAAALMAGTASGSLMSALFVQLLPEPTELVYIFLSGVFLIQALGASRITETSARVAGARRALAPKLALPSQVRGSVFVAAPILVAVWSLGGFYASLGPSLAQLVAGDRSMILGGAALFLLAGSGSLTVLSFHKVEARRLALFGALAIMFGSSLLLAGVASRSLLLFTLGIFPAGAGFGAGFQGGLRTIVAKAEPHERAGVISLVYVISYLSLGLPAIIAGTLVVNSSLAQVSEELGGAVILLATLTAAGLASTLWREARTEAARTDAARAEAVCPAV